MFPTLDGDLGSVANHFRFDQLVEAVNECAESVENELKTPLQNEKQFPSSSNDPVATVADEEDEEPTLSTDFASTHKESKMPIQQHSDGVESTATKLLEAIINKSPPKRRPEKLSNITKLARGANNQIRKQKSLHGSETMPVITGETSNRFPRRNYEYSRFMSVDQRSQSDTEDNVAIESGHCMKSKDSKTQSCANLKLSCAAPRSPGALVIKEKYIELPKQVAKRTNSSSSKDKDLDTLTKSTSLTSSIESITRLSGKATKPRFTTTKVDESQLGASVLKK